MKITGRSADFFTKKRRRGAHVDPITGLQALVHIERALSAGDNTDIQLNFAAGGWRAGNRERPAADIVRQLQVDVLAGLEIHAFGRVELDPTLDGQGQVFDAVTTPG